MIDALRYHRLLDALRPISVLGWAIVAAERLT